MLILAALAALLIRPEQAARLNLAVTIFGFAMMVLAILGVIRRRGG